MNQRIVIIGSGFAGMWAALSAARVVTSAGRERDVDVVVVSPSATLTIRPRLYEAMVDDVTPDIAPLLAAVDVRHLAGCVEAIDVDAREIALVTAEGRGERLAYDRLILATGSQLYRPAIPGLAEHAFDADQHGSALALDAHLRALATRPDSPARGSVVVVGGGFTGLEVATEMPGRLRAALGDGASIRVVIVDSAPNVGIAMGAAALPLVEDALADAGIETRAGARVVAIDADGAALSSGEKIAAHTVIWAAGLRASPLAAQLPGEHDELGRVVGDPFLRVPAAKAIFATGDAVKAATDSEGNFNLMSCQHAIQLGRVAGHNAAADIVGLPLLPYRQPKYVTCLDLGAWGALLTEGWDRQVRLTRGDAKPIKRDIVTRLIYPPAPDRETAFALADPESAFA